MNDVFTKSFSISKRETYKKLENAALKTETAKADTSNIIPDLKRSEQELLNMLRGEGVDMPKHAKQQDINKLMQYDYMLLVSNGGALIGHWWGYNEVGKMLSAWSKEKLNDKKPILLLADGQPVLEVQTFKDLFELYE